MAGKQFGHRYEDIISVENLLIAWTEFVRGKRGRADMQVFERNLMASILSLHCDLANDTYRHKPSTLRKRESSELFLSRSSDDDRPSHGGAG